ncbi:MAG TPA: RagB/SusD family nutrient uptake outer membrane protein [Bacteroidales bacterium]|nr:RagB/SusD family nutrient uptake outer membrane protein [Bacteroidales bacterium]HPJ60772.1 RagB/SusD family nutrient uptake outer membrane protein [Bacteroidales bacterium]HPR10744.1 RagB/SusD family nutrient uptake outer membrane protein [Bacteroidales bacterium]HRW85953.1 RagB/SusD family nutrient uptake outer membrane protein [Bacteroidales bacterium]
MKTYRIILLSVLLIFVTLSCEDILDRTPLDKINAEDVFADEILTQAYVTNLYSRFPFNDFRSQQTTQSDEMTTSTDNRSNVTQGTVSKTSEANALWDYTYIRDMTDFIDKIRASSLKESVKTQLEGEVRFLRAFVYFEMQKRYGGVPLVDMVIDPFVLPIDQKYTKRSTEEEIYNFIDSELADIIPMLSATPDPKGRVNRYTAFALRARANLWSASIAKFSTVQLNGLVGIPASRTNELYTKASVAADSVILSGKYSLYNPVPSDKVENYRLIFIDESHSEIIWERVYDGVNIGHGWDAWNAPNQFAGRGGTWDPTLEFLLGYENVDGSADEPLFGVDYLYDNGRGPFMKKDPRLFATVFFEKDAWSGGTVKTYEGIDTSSTVPDVSKIVSNVTGSYNGMEYVGIDSRTQVKDDFSTNSGFLPKKFTDGRNIQIPDGQSITNWPLFRLAEMYLTKAEAEFEMGHLAIAAAALNPTRQRAGITLVDETTITRDLVRTERRSELAFENFRYWDLRRWRVSETVLNHRFQGLRIIYHYASGKYYFLPIFCESFTRTFLAAHYYNPITDSRLNNNPDLIENPLY